MKKWLFSISEEEKRQAVSLTSLLRRQCVVSRRSKNSFRYLRRTKKRKENSSPKELLFLNSHSKATKRYILNHCNLVIMLNYNFVKQRLKRPPLSSSDTASWNYQTVRAPLLPQRHHLKPQRAVRNSRKNVFFPL